MASATITTTTKEKGTPKLLYGTGFLGTSRTFPTSKETAKLLAFLKSNGITNLDTARRYPAIAPGRAEELLGEADAAALGFTIDTKIEIPAADGPAGSLTAANIAASVDKSYTALQLQGSASVNILYPHMPDPTTPIADSARGFNALHSAGRFKHLGLSNSTVPQIEEWLRVCAERGYVRPSVYQGQYNPLCRRAEEDGLLDLLRENGIAFHAYSPLAGGFLTGKATRGKTEGTRFEEGDVMGMAHRRWYDRVVMHDAVSKLQRVGEGFGLGLSEVAVRWLMHHSALGEGDGVIIGGSSTEQIGRNVEDAAKGPLPEDVVRAVDEMWVSVREEAP